MTRAELEEMRADGMSAARRAELRLAAERSRAWDTSRSRGIDALLELCASLRRLFGDLPPDTRPWRGVDYRL